MIKRRRRLLAAGATFAVLVVAAVALIAWTPALWRGLDGASLSKSEVLTFREPCGIGGAEFASPVDATGDGFQEHTYRFRYEHLDAAWVDANILNRFGLFEPIDERTPITVRTARTTDGAPPATSAFPTVPDGNHYHQAELTTPQGSLVFQSPFSLSDVGTTAFDVYRSTSSSTETSYSVLVECNNRAGIHYDLTLGAVTTSIP